MKEFDWAWVGSEGGLPLRSNIPRYHSTFYT
jgi:hypothetical protein